MITLIYKNGHFYKKNGKRISLTDGAELEVANSSIIKEETHVGNKKKAKLTPAQLEATMLQNKNTQVYSAYQMIVPQDTKLYFSILRQSNVIQNTVQKFVFEVELLEDLYAYKNTNAKNVRLYDSACKVTRIITNNIDFFEEVYAKSLNEIYKRTFVHYFGNKGNPACNALDRFFEVQSNENTTIRSKIKI